MSKSTRKEHKTQEVEIVAETVPYQNEEVKVFTHSQLREALLYLEDSMDRAVMQWFLTGDTCRECKNGGDLTVQEITGGVTAPTFNAGISVLKSVIPNLVVHYSPDDSKRLEDAKYITFEFEDVPVRVDVIHNKYEVFKNLDIINYDVTSFYTPNPFIEYFANKEIYE